MGTLFVTGANRGLGLAIVDKFASQGYNIITQTRKKYVDFEDHCLTLSQQNGVRFYHIYMDLSNEDSVKKGLKIYSSLKITPTVLVNNASVPYDKILFFSKIEEIKNVFQINYFSPVLITQKVVKNMLKTGGSIINISSVSSLTKQSAGTGYSASKAAMNVFTTSLAQELSQFKIRVNAIAPGGMNTEMFTSTNDKNKEALIASNAARRVSEPSEIADVVYFLASNESSYINGQIIRVDGGMIY